MDTLKDLAAGGIANAVASAILNPCDVVKVRLQAQGQQGLYRSPVHAAGRILAEEGAFAMWGGLFLPGIGASVLRDVSYSSLRFGLYGPTKLLLGGRDRDVGLGRKILSGAISGCD